MDANTGKLFRIDLGRDRASIRAIDEIEGATVPGGDGLLLDRGRLVVVQGNPAQLSFVKLRAAARRATLERTQTSDRLRGPSTVARAKDRYLVVNADFATSTRPFTVAALRRQGGLRGRTKCRHERVRSARGHGAGCRTKDRTR